jgi:aryl-alcohol dehydrogenase-like predicted oxidoreductase
VRAQQRRATVIPIVGARTSEQIHDSLGAVDIELSADELDRLEQLSRIDLGFPHDFAGRAMAHGTTFELVDDHRRHAYSQLGPAPLATVDTGGSG